MTNNNKNKTMQNILDFIDGLSNHTLNKIRNSKSDAEARRILKETNAELLQSRVVGRSEQLADFCKKVSSQKDCPAEFQEIVNKEFWNLIS